MSGTSRAIALAALRLIASSNLVGSSTGSSESCQRTRRRDGTYVAGRPRTRSPPTSENALLPYTIGSRVVVARSAICRRVLASNASSSVSRSAAPAFAGCSTRLSEQRHKPIRDRLANYKIVLCPETTPNCGLKLVQGRVPARCRVQSHRSKFPRAIGRGVSKRRSPCECPIALTRMIRDKASPNQIIDFVGGTEPALAQVERMFLAGGWPLPRLADPCFSSLRGHGFSP